MGRFLTTVIAVITLALVVASLSSNTAHTQNPRILTAGYQNLAGMWQFALDRGDSGVKDQWYKNRFRDYLKLPGVLQAQGYGDEVSTNTRWVSSLDDRYWYLRDDYKAYADPGKVKVPFLSQPPRHYLGVAWYQRNIQISQYQQSRRLVLTLERPHWETTVWLDENKIGSDRSMVAPHIYDLGTVPQGQHRLTIRVDNRMLAPYRPDAHSVSDAVAASWNGIAGRIDLTDTGRIWIDDAQVFPNLEQKMMLIKVRIGNITGRSGAGTLTAIWPDVGVVPVTWDEHGGNAELEVPIRFDAPTWDEFHPKMLPLRLWLRGTGFDEYKQLNIGLRDLRADGKQFVLNGKPIIFRGTNQGSDFPKTGYPEMEVKYWSKLFETCRAWGLNHMRFHSWCPPEAAFEAADQLGFYLQPEPGMWNEISPGTDMERILYEETDRLIKAYGNHPSFMLLSASNEPKGKWQEALSKWVEHYRKEDPRRMYASGTGHTERELPNPDKGTDYLAIQRIDAKMLRRESGWFGADFGESLADINVPVISHEVGQWSAYPDYEVIKKFDGYMRPGNYEIFRDSMKAHGLLEKNKAFAMASGRFQLACYKEEIEANLRTPGLGGFQLLDLHDYPGQGTALIGLLDAFWESKGYATAADFKDFCNTTVPLARLRSRVFTTADPFNVDVELAHFGAEPMENSKGVWRIVGTQPEIKGEWEAQTFPIGKNIPLGRIAVDLSTLAPGEYQLVVTVAPTKFFSPVTRRIVAGPGVVRGSTYFENEWNFWVYPSLVRTTTGAGTNADCPPSRIADVLITNSWDEAETRLAAGGKVLLVPRNEDLDWTSPPLDRVPIFWNRMMNPAWGRMLGLLIDRKPNESKNHMLDGFPTGTSFDWQWAQIIDNVRAINMDRLPVELEPLVWAIDDWNRNYKLGVLFEGAVGDGRLLVSAFDVTRPGDSNPVMSQLRNSLLSYMRSDCFQPQVSLTVEQLRGLFFDTKVMKKLRARAYSQGESANSAIDGDPNTFWRTGSQGDPARDQGELTIEFPEPVAMAGLVLMGRQNHREHEGDIREYVVRVSDDGKEWRDVVGGELGSTYAPQTLQFVRTVKGRYLKLISLSGFGPDKTTALAELAVIEASPKPTGASRTKK